MRGPDPWSLPIKGLRDKADEAAARLADLDRAVVALAKEVLGVLGPALGRHDQDIRQSLLRVAAAVRGGAREDAAHRDHRQAVPLADSLEEAADGYRGD